MYSREVGQMHHITSIGNYQTIQEKKKMTFPQAFLGSIYIKSV